MKNLITLLLLILFFLFYGSRSIFSQNTDTTRKDVFSMDLEELMNTKVSIATKTDQHISETPSSVSVITEEEIRNMGARELEDVLQTIPGFELVRGTNGYYGVGIRGVKDFRNTSRILVMINGNPFNQIFYGASIEYGYDIDIDDVERIEIIRGPGSALYGRNAFSGVINILTKNAMNGKKYMAKGSLGTYNHKSLSGYYGYKEGKFNALFSIKNLKSDVNSIDFPNDYGDTLTYNLNRNNYLLNSSIGYGDFKFSGMFMNIDQRGSLMDTRVYRKHGIYSISYSKSLNPKLNFDAKIFGQNGSYIQDFEALNPGLSTTYPLGIYYKPQFVEYLYGFETNIGYDLLDNNSILFGLQADIHGVKDSKITANIDMGTHDPINGIGRNNQVDYTPGWIDKNGHNYNNIAFFIQDIWHPVKKLGITIGGRFDLDSEIGGIFNPRTGMVYEPFKDLSIKLLYGRAYRAPTPEEQYKTLGFIRGNKNLKPEIINTFEFEISQRFDKISNAVNIFSNKLSNMIYSQLITSINTNTSFYNIGKNSSNGIEYQFKYQAMKRFYTYLNCTYTVSENTNTINGKDTIFNQPDIAPFKINIGLNYSFLSHFSFNANTFYRSKMDKLYATDQNNQLVEVNDNIGNYWILNSTFRISNFIKKVEFSLSVYNILDTKYFSQDNERLNQPSQPGRQFIVSLIYSFK